VAADHTRPQSASVCPATAVAGPFRPHVTFLGYTSCQAANRPARCARSERVCCKVWSRSGVRDEPGGDRDTIDREGHGHGHGHDADDWDVAPGRDDDWDAVPGRDEGPDVGRDGRHPPGAPDKARVAELTHTLLEEIGEDPEREGLVDTPLRVARSLSYLTSGYRQSLVGVVGNALYAEDYDELLLVRDIEFYSLCEHHMLPFFGRAHVAYLPAGRVLGLSKLPRIVELYARRLQLQERLTREIAVAVQTVTRPRGVGVVLEAEHLCMAMRGVRKPGSRTVTSCLLGELDADPGRRAEFLALVWRE